MDVVPISLSSLGVLREEPKARLLRNGLAKFKSQGVRQTLTRLLVYLSTCLLTYLPPSPSRLLQPVLIQKCFILKDFTRHPISHDLTIVHHDHARE